MSLIITLLVNGLAVFITGYILPGVTLDSYLTAIFVAVILGVVNTFVKPLLLLLTLPLNILTFGFFTFILNAILVLVVDAIIPGFAVANFWWALLFSLVLSLVSTFLFSLTGDERKLRTV